MNASGIYTMHADEIAQLLTAPTIQRTALAFAHAATAKIASPLLAPDTVRLCIQSMAFDPEIHTVSWAIEHDHCGALARHLETTLPRERDRIGIAIAKCGTARLLDVYLDNSLPLDNLVIIAAAHANEDVLRALVARGSRIHTETIITHYSASITDCLIELGANPRTMGWYAALMRSESKIAALAKYDAAVAPMLGIMRISDGVALFKILHSHGVICVKSAMLHAVEADNVNILKHVLDMHRIDYADILVAVRRAIRAGRIGLLAVLIDRGKFIEMAPLCVLLELNSSVGFRMAINDLGASAAIALRGRGL